jgi:hypothetical protein
MFGIGVKLSAFEAPDAIDEVDLSEAIDDALGAIAEITGVDFIAATAETDSEA